MIIVKGTGEVHNSSSEKKCSNPNYTMNGKKGTEIIINLQRVPYILHNIMNMSIRHSLAVTYVWKCIKSNTNINVYKF